MPLTKKEQKTFEKRFLEIQDVHPASDFIDKVADLIFEMTGNVNLGMRFFKISEKLKRKEDAS